MKDMGDRLGWELSTAIVLFHEALGRSLGIGAADYKALGVIRREGPLPLGALSSRLAVVPSAVTAIVDRLEQAGCVNRTPSPGDRRKVLVRAIPLDRTAEAQAFQHLGEATATFMHSLTEDQRAAVLDYIALTIDLVTEQTRRLRAPPR